MRLKCGGKHAVGGNFQRILYDLSRLNTQRKPAMVVHHRRTFMKSCGFTINQARAFYLFKIIFIS